MDFTKDRILMIASIVVAGLGILVLSRGGTGSNLPASNLYPENSISHAHGLAVNVSDASKVYIATHHGVLLLQDDQILYRIGKSTDDYMGFSVHPTEANTFFSSGHSRNGGNVGFQKSEDGGVTWQRISGGLNGPVDFHALAVSPVNPNLVYGWYQGGLQRSHDQGKTWEVVNSTIQPLHLAGDTKDENTVYAATAQGLVISRDKGVTWNPLSTDLTGAGVSTVAIHPREASTLLTYSEKLGGLGKSTDSGVSWQKIPERFNNEIVLHIAFSNITPNVVYVLTHENSLYKSVDTGQTWSRIR